MRINDADSQPMYIWRKCTLKQMYIRRECKYLSNVHSAQCTSFNDH